MRRILPLAVIAFIGLFILAIIVGGAVLVGLGVSVMVSESNSKNEAARNEPTGPGPQTLLDARKNFRTAAVKSDFQSKGAVLAAPDWNIVQYKSRHNDLMLAAYLSHPRRLKERMNERASGIVFVHDGFGGIDPEMLEQLAVFRAAGFAVMCPSFRGENSNPGNFEMYYGEVNDLLGAVDFLSSQAGVDPKRIYVVGVGTGGTLTLLAAANGQFSTAHAFFAVGGCPDLKDCLADRGNTTPPFDPISDREVVLRSASKFLPSIQRQTFYFTLEPDMPAGNAAVAMANEARKLKVPFRVVNLKGNAARSDLVAASLKLISQKIAGDNILTDIIMGPDVDATEILNK